MMYAIFDQIKKGFFPAGSTIVCLHTGGLQGNESLPKGSLIF
jgi:1-aminocyclopropane-1-carboxylate deaminase/D-cysteine desulfhydrase-like pyridoxal-dependent ACC family enzyme